MKKIIIPLLSTIFVVSSIGLAACTDKPVDETPKTDDVHVHAWVEDTSKSKTATCGEAGRKYYTCECGATKNERGAKATGQHNYGDGHVCQDCGFIDMSHLTEQEAIEEYGFYLIDKDESNTYTTNDIVIFGNYPQELVNKNDLMADEPTTHADVTVDSELLAKLNEQQNVLPTATEKGDWTSYGYYDEGTQSDYMFYKDVTVDGEMYRGVYLLKYRGTSYTDAATADNSYIDDELYNLNTVYWFKYTPISWLVLDYIDGNILLNSQYCLDGQPYQDLYETNNNNKVIPGTTDNINTWEKSSLRKFLNETFLNCAFTDDEQELIDTVTIDNKTATYDSCKAYQNIQNNTQDKLFLLSSEDMINTDYGFPENDDYDKAISQQGNDPDFSEEAQIRRRSFSDYTMIQNVRRSTVAHTASNEPVCWYSIRSSGYSSETILGITKYGSIEVKNNYAYSVNAIVPSLYLKVGK